MNHIDERLLADFENQLNPACPELSGIPPKILGYGEISTTFAIPALPGIAFKRMPPFATDDDIAEYKKAVIQYCDDLHKQAGLAVAPCNFHTIHNQDSEIILYVSQPRFTAESIGNAFLKVADEARLAPLIQTVISHLFPIARINRDRPDGYAIGIDGQISNWSFQANGEALYFDITTPMFRVNGKDQMDPEIFLKSSPSFLTWIIRWFFLKEVLDRYYDMRLVFIDLLANFHKEGRPERIDPMMSLINQNISEERMEETISLLTRKEIDDYYRNDARIWRIFLALRRIDRFLKTRVLGKKYNFILPGKIRR
jgi:hypothetical protein